MLFHYLFLISTLVYSAASNSDKCISFTYEDGFNTMFRNDVGPCASVLRPWGEKSYSQSSINAPHDYSTKHISPQNEFSCASSFLFTMSENGVVEVTVYMSGDTPREQLVVVVNQYESLNNYVSVGSVFLHPASENFVKGWSTHRISVGGSGTFQGYVSFLGMAGEDSTVLVDSFRYIPPTTKDVDCHLYNGIPQAITPTTRVFGQKGPSKIREMVVTETINVPQMRIEVEAGTPQGVTTRTNSFAHTHIFTSDRTSATTVTTATTSPRSAMGELVESRAEAEATACEDVLSNNSTGYKEEYSLLHSVNSLGEAPSPAHFHTKTNTDTYTITHKFTESFSETVTDDTLKSSPLGTFSTDAQTSSLVYNDTTFTQTQTTLNLETQTTSSGARSSSTFTTTALVSQNILSTHVHTHTNTHRRVHNHTHTLTHTHIHSNGHIHIHTHTHIVHHSIVHVHTTTHTHNHTLRP